jgi:ABC-type transporter Mla subunit MlaD
MAPKLLDTLDLNIIGKIMVVFLVLFIVAMNILSYALNYMPGGCSTPTTYTYYSFSPLN